MRYDHVEELMAPYYAPGCKPTLRWYRIRTPRTVGSVQIRGGTCVKATAQFLSMVNMKIRTIQSICGRNKWVFTRKGVNR